MSKNYMNDSQASEIMKYISDTMKFPVMGAGGGFAPIGAEAYFDGQVAPLGWVICDGTELNIADYPDLATYYASQHGASNYYGGNGTTTFATPKRSGMPNNDIQTPNEHIVGEWRETVSSVLKKKPLYERTWYFNKTSGESTVFSLTTLNIDEIFLKEAFTYNRDDTYDGVGTYFQSDSDKMRFFINPSKDMICQTGTMFMNGKVRATFRYTKTTDSWQPVQEGHSSDGNGIFCVKATVSGDANAHQYSTEEQVVGMTEDGEVIYEITLKGNKPINTVNQNVSIPVSGTIVSYAIDGYIKTAGGDLVKLGYWNNAQADSFQAFVNTSNKRICILPTNLAGTYRFVYQYTKTSS